MPKEKFIIYEYKGEPRMAILEQSPDKLIALGGSVLIACAETASQLLVSNGYSGWDYYEAKGAPICYITEEGFMPLEKK